MTTKTNDTKQSNDRPTHSLYVKTTQFGNPINMRIAAMWNNTNKGYMGVRMEKLELQENPNKSDGQPPYILNVNTKIYGQDALVQIGTAMEKEDKTGFEINLGDVVVFENKPREVVSQKKTTTNNTPRP